MFQSFLQGGFEASSHRRRDGRQLDVLAACGHDTQAARDYRLLQGAGLRTARDALRWHCIEARPGVYDWSSFVPMLRATRDTGMQVIWDLCHYGIPHDLDIWSTEFPRRFAAFAAAAARVVRDETDGVPHWCPMNEISYWAWAGGDAQRMHPYAPGRGPALKRQLVRAATAASRAVREVDPRARFLQAEPLIHITAHPDRPHDHEAAETHRLSQFQAWDMIAGRMEPELGGGPDLLDLVGINFYFNNQWVHGAETLGLGHHLYRPLRDMLAEVHARYGRPLLISETGAEGANGPGWMRYVCHEVRAALRRGVPVEGLCIYPIMDYPGWDNSRHCPSGLIHTDARFERRWVDTELAEVLHEEAASFAPFLYRPSAIAAE